MSYRIVFFGTPEFAVPSLAALLDGADEVVGVFCQPDRPAGRGQRLHPPPVKVLAEERGVPVAQPAKLRDGRAVELLHGWNPDVVVVAAYGRILPRDILDLPPLGCINVHASLLPKYRGAAPINWALYHGDQVTGVTVIHMTPKLDAGPCIAQAELPIEPEATAPEVEEQLSQLGARLVVEAVDRLEAGTAEPLPQDPALVSQAPRLTKQDGAVDWSRPAESIRNQIRAMEPWPRTYTYWFRPEHEPLRLILGPAVTRPAEGSATPGQVVHADHERLVIATGKGQLELTSVQPSGKRMLPVAEFLNGYPVRVGERFGPHE